MRRSFLPLALLVAAPVAAQVNTTPPPVPTPRSQPSPPVGPGSINNPPVISAPPAVGRTFQRPILGGPPGDTIPTDRASSIARPDFPATAAPIVTNTILQPRAGTLLTATNVAISGFPPGPVLATNLGGQPFPVGLATNPPVALPGFDPEGVRVGPTRGTVIVAPNLNQPVGGTFPRTTPAPFTGAGGPGIGEVGSGTSTLLPPGSTIRRGPAATASPASPVQTPGATPPAGPSVATPR